MSYFLHLNLDSYRNDPLPATRHDLWHFLQLVKLFSLINNVPGNYFPDKLCFSFILFVSFIIASSNLLNQ
jgi:hypothetical protein